MLWPCEPCGWPQPMITSSTSLGSSCGTLPRTSLMVCAVKSSGRVMLNEPRNDLASGVRELATMTASLMKTSFYRRTSVGGAPASRDRKVRTASIDGRSGHDLDEVLGRSQPRLDGRARGSVGGIDPGVPGRVHVVVDAHVGHVHGGREDLRLVAADGGQGLVDLLQDLLGLALGVRRGVCDPHGNQVRKDHRRTVTQKRTHYKAGIPRHPGPALFFVCGRPRPGVLGRGGHEDRPMTEGEEPIVGRRGSRVKGGIQAVRLWAGLMPAGGHPILR